MDTSTKLEIVCFIPDYNGEFAIKTEEDGGGKRKKHVAQSLSI